MAPQVRQIDKVGARLRLQTGQFIGLKFSGELDLNYFGNDPLKQGDIIKNYFK